MWAVWNGSTDIVRLLVKFGASLETVNAVHIHEHALANTLLSEGCEMMISYMYVCIYIYIHMYV